MPLDPLTMSLILGGAGVATNIIRGAKQASRAKDFEADFEAKDKALQPVSPEQYAYLNRVRQMQRSMAMGTDPTSAMAQRGLSQSLAQTQGNIARLGTGASTVSGLLRAQQGYNMGMGQVAGQAFDQSRAYMQQEQGLIDNIQKSIYGLQMKRRNYAQQKAVAMRQDASDSATAAIAGLGQMATMIPKMSGGGGIEDFANAPIQKMAPRQIDTSNLIDVGEKTLAGPSQNVYDAIYGIKTMKPREILPSITPIGERKLFGT